MPEGTGTTEGTSQTAGEAGTSTQDGTTGTGAATQNAGTGTTEQTFSKADVERIVKERLDREKESARKKAEEDDAKKRGDYEALTKQEQAKTEAALTRLKARAVQAEVAVHAGKLNLVDTETAMALIQGKVEYDDDGEPTNVEKLLTDLVKAKSFLVKGQGQVTSATSTANPGGKVGTKFDPKSPPTWGAAFGKR